MSSANRGRYGHHLDATAGREVVYCHACSYEWFRDDFGLTCPACHSDITEIVSPESDPRDIGEHMLDTASPGLTSDAELDSDPEEADIDEHMSGQNRVAFNRTIRTRGSNRPRHDPGMENIFHSIVDMVYALGPQNQNQNLNGGQAQGQGEGEGHTQSQDQSRGQTQDQTQDQFRAWQSLNQDQFPSGAGYSRTTGDGFSQPHVHRTTFRTGTFGNGTASVTIFSGPIRATSAGAENAPPMADRDPFQDLFTSIMQGMGPSGTASGLPIGGQTTNMGTPTFMRSLQDILGLVNPAHAMSGDAVYSQEALDRIISNFMEANPQSNAAPPATEQALERLERKTVSKEMLAGESSVECPICIDDMKEGNTAVFLPCKHWFHEECVVLWLREHDTCPICRSPIEKRDSEGGNDDNGNRDADNSNSNSHSGPRNARGLGGGFAGSSMSGSGSGSRSFSFARSGSGPGTVPSPVPGVGEGNSSYRSPFSGMSRWAQSEGSESPFTPGAGSSRSHISASWRLGGPSQSQPPSQTSSYDTSRLQRRNSQSPTGPAGPAGSAGSRSSGPREQQHRQRSPQGSGRWERNERNERSGRSERPERNEDTSNASGHSVGRSSGQGPLSWLRNRFSSSDSHHGSHDQN